MGVLDGVANVGEAAQQLTEPELARSRAATGRRWWPCRAVEGVNGLLEAVPPDEPHGVVRTAIRVSAQAVDRDDPRVLQPAGNLRLQHEASAAGRVVGVPVKDLLERDLAIQLLVERHENGAQASLGMRSQHPKPPVVGGGRAQGEASGALGVAVDGRCLTGGRVAECHSQVRVAQIGQAFACGFAGRDGGEAFLQSAPVGLNV